MSEEKELLDLKVEQSLLDANFDGYKLSLDPLPLKELELKGWNLLEKIITCIFCKSMWITLMSLQSLCTLKWQQIAYLFLATRLLSFRVALPEFWLQNRTQRDQLQLKMDARFRHSCIFSVFEFALPEQGDVFLNSSIIVSCSSLKSRTCTVGKFPWKILVSRNWMARKANAVPQFSSLRYSSLTAMRNSTDSDLEIANLYKSFLLNTTIRVLIFSFFTRFTEIQ